MGITDKAQEGSTTSFFKNIFMNFDTSKEDSPLLLAETPEEISLKLLTVESEYWHTLLEMDQKRSQLLFEREAASDDEKEVINAQLIKLDEEMASFKASKLQYASKLNDYISNKNSEELQEIQQVSEHIQKITVKDGQDKVRSFRKILHFSDLKRRLEGYYPQSTFLLSKSGTNEVVGSQDELFFAFKEVPQEEHVLALDLTISNKRKLDEEEYDESDSCSSVQLQHVHVGPWTDAEAVRFKTGIDAHGWGRWKQVAAVVATRTPKQVAKYSENGQAKRLRPTDSITGAWVNLAAGFDRVSKGLQEK